ncbi:hypothetical protein TRIP_D210035 [uncultured Paludibacter sp.]|nr:hypothetical protein TRIP_D210035 [uncultured Paludibacter sp.]
MYCISRLWNSTRKSCCNDRLSYCTRLGKISQMGARYRIYCGRSWTCRTLDEIIYALYVYVQSKSIASLVDDTGIKQFTVELNKKTSKKQKYKI